MGRLIYSVIMSLDGYIADENDNFDWAAPDVEVHEFVNELERPIGTYLYGRRMYDTMRYWQTAPLDDPVRAARDYAGIWQAADKIVFSSTLDASLTPKTRIERTFDPSTIRALKSTSPTDLSIGGPHLAFQAIAAGLVDELHLFLAPVAVGGGNAALPRGLRLNLVSNRRFDSGFVHLHYRVSPGGLDPVPL